MQPRMAGAAGAIRRRVAACALLALWGCSEAPDQLVQVGDAHYAIPLAHIVSTRQQPELFFRISRPGEGFDLVYDARTADSLDARGVPVIFSISDSETTTLQYHRTSSGWLVCQRAVNPNGGCGTPLVEAGAHWSVLIPPARAADVDRVVAEARATLNSYRVR